MTLESGHRAEGKAAGTGTGRSARDPRLDLFRGIAMLIIFVAHVPWNFWAELIPARWGASDAAEMFVFCSGYAAALAFGGTFLRAGFLLGTVRILFRCWQIYWAQLGLVLAITLVCLLLDRHAPRTVIDAVWQDGMSYVEALNLGMLLQDPGAALLGLMTLRWVPNFFDILPMYIVVLLLVPAVMALARYDTRLAIAFVIGLYLANRVVGLDLPAEPWSDRPWFFNPFAWQLLFFTGFALARGWIEPPPQSRLMVGLCLGYVLVLVPICQWRFHEAFPPLQSVFDWLLPAPAKTNLYPVRYLHFLALAYLALAFLRAVPRLVHAPVLRPVIKVGQQALPSFLLSMTLAWTGGAVLDHLGRGPWQLALVNVSGLSAIVACAYFTGWLKAEPWNRRNRQAGDRAAAAEHGPTRVEGDRNALPERRRLAAEGA